MRNNMTNLHIEFHILQSFPVTCLNRDDVGAPKTAIVGGMERARVSSQCWKRYVRLALHELGVKTGIRTKKLNMLITQACIRLGADEASALACANKIANELADDTLIFVTDAEVEALARYAQEKNFNIKEMGAKDLAKAVKKSTTPAQSALDIALFGRMVAKASEMNVQAAASFNHAISTHRATSEVEFFTAMDDLPDEDKGGSAHMGSLEFNSATYYRYISLDLGQLADTLGIEDHGQDKTLIRQAIESFTKALFIAVPDARQTTQSGACPWDFARVLVRRGQRLQASFEKPVPADKNGYSANSIIRLNTWIDGMASKCGSLYGKLGDYRWGDNEHYSVDQLISDLQNCVEQS